MCFAFSYQFNFNQKNAAIYSCGFCQIAFFARFLTYTTFTIIPQQVGLLYQSEFYTSVIWFRNYKFKIRH